MFFYFYVFISTVSFISIFYLPYKFVLLTLAILFFVFLVYKKSFSQSIKKIIYIMPYFFGVLIIQALTPRGEYYKIFFLYLDKIGTDFTIVYFTKIAAVLYFLNLFFIFSKKIKIPNNTILNEAVKINIFMKIVRKSFFYELNFIVKTKSTLKEKINLILSLIKNVYEDVFKNYPYDMYFERFKYKNSLL